MSTPEFEKLKAQIRKQQRNFKAAEQLFDPYNTENVQSGSAQKAVQIFAGNDLDDDEAVLLADILLDFNG